MGVLVWGHSNIQINNTDRKSSGIALIPTAIFIRNNNVVITMRGDTSMPEQNGQQFADDIFKCILLNEKFYFQFWLMFVPGVIFIIGSGNGLAQNRSQVITWAKGGQFPRRHNLSIDCISCLILNILCKFLPV